GSAAGAAGRRLGAPPSAGLVGPGRPPAVGAPDWTSRRVLLHRRNGFMGVAGVAGEHHRVDGWLASLTVSEVSFTSAAGAVLSSAVPAAPIASTTSRPLVTVPMIGNTGASGS